MTTATIERVGATMHTNGHAAETGKSWVHLMPETPRRGTNYASAYGRSGLLLGHDTLKAMGNPAYLAISVREDGLIGLAPAQHQSLFAFRVSAHRHGGYVRCPEIAARLIGRTQLPVTNEGTYFAVDPR